MTLDDFDARLTAAVRSLVPEPISADVVQAGGELAVTRRSSLLKGGALGGVAVALVLATIVVPRLAGVASFTAPQITTPPAEAGSATMPSVTTSDGRVSTERSGASIQLVLRRDGQPPLVLASLAEAVPPAVASFVSVHFVGCPSSTGLAQRYYVFGQANHASGAITYTGITGVGSVGGGRYVIAITSDPTLHDWRFWIGRKPLGAGGGASASTFAQLSSMGSKTESGCYLVK